MSVAFSHKNSPDQNIHQSNAWYFSSIFIKSNLYMIQIFPLIGGAVSIFNILPDYLETMKRPKTDLNVKNCKGRHSPPLFFFLCFEKKVKASVSSSIKSTGFDVSVISLTLNICKKYFDVRQSFDPWRTAESLFLKR